MLATASRDPVARASEGSRSLEPAAATSADLRHVASLVGNRSMTALLQRQGTKGAPRDAKHPESFPVYEDWLDSFQRLDTFTSNDTWKSAGKGDEPFEVHFNVLGDRPAST